MIGNYHQIRARLCVVFAYSLCYATFYNRRPKRKDFSPHLQTTAENVKLLFSELLDLSLYILGYFFFSCSVQPKPRLQISYCRTYKVCVLSLFLQPSTLHWRCHAPPGNAINRMKNWFLYSDVVVGKFTDQVGAQIRQTAIPFDERSLCTQSSPYKYKRIICVSIYTTIKYYNCAAARDIWWEQLLHLGCSNSGRNWSFVGN
jgi:hypothetical protein